MEWDSGVVEGESSRERLCYIGRWKGKGKISEAVAVYEMGSCVGATDLTLIRAQWWAEALRASKATIGTTTMYTMYAVHSTNHSKYMVDGTV